VERGRGDNEIVLSTASAVTFLSQQMWQLLPNRHFSGVAADIARLHRRRMVDAHFRCGWQ
jgi:hypothetical protein